MQSNESSRQGSKTARTPRWQVSTEGARGRLNRTRITDADDYDTIAVLPTSDRNHPHARLIAAAPELADACQAVLGSLNHGTDNPHWVHINRIRKALKSAGRL